MNKGDKNLGEKNNINKDFFRGEFRHGFFISTNMKKYWAGMIDVLCEIDRICRKHDIAYFAYGGTLLGAVRHNGIIPWDDDIDIAMKREDYNRFLIVCEQELDEKFVFLKPFTSAKYKEFFSRIVERYEYKLEKNEGGKSNNHLIAGVDIFVLDYMAVNDEELELQIELSAIIGSLCKKIIDGEEEIEQIEDNISQVEDVLGITINRSGNLIEQLRALFFNICQMYACEEAKEMTVLPILRLTPFWRFKKEWYDDVVFLDFEYIRIPCPKEYIKVLETGYETDWRIPIRSFAEHDYPVYNKYKEDYKKSWEAMLKDSLTRELSTFFGVSPARIDVKELIKYGVRNSTVLFSLDDCELVLRIPMSRIIKLTDYQMENSIYGMLKDYDVTDKLLYISPDNGNKISFMIHNAHSLNYENKDEVLDCLNVMSFIHHLEVAEPVSFDLWDCIERYEKLWGDESFYVNYDEDKKKIRECYEYAMKQPKQIGITHFGLSRDNFLITDCEDGARDIRIIDWEFAGIQDTHIDIAVFALNAIYWYEDNNEEEIIVEYDENSEEVYKNEAILSAVYTNEEIDWLIDSYFDNKCPDNIRLKIYCYIAVCGLLFSNYYEYIDRKGEDMTQEQAAIHQRALDYYELFRSLI